MSGPLPAFVRPRARCDRCKVDDDGSLDVEMAWSTRRGVYLCFRCLVDAHYGQVFGEPIPLPSKPRRRRSDGKGKPATTPTKKDTRTKKRATLMRHDPQEVIFGYGVPSLLAVVETAKEAPWWQPVALVLLSIVYAGLRSLITSQSKEKALAEALAEAKNEIFSLRRETRRLKGDDVE